jgi:lysyl-tRNA synthetase class 2
VAAPALEDHIDAEPAGNAFLRTSPELHMKRLLAAGFERIFQVGPCFRRGECGRRHQPEFTLLEWYRAGADYLGILAESEALLRRVTESCLGEACIRFGGRVIRVDEPWERLTVDAAFQRYAGTNPEACFARGDGVFEQVLLEQIEPHLGHARPTALLDYPLALGALAARCPGRPQRAARWEVYVAGLELANAFSELTDAAEQRQRFLDTAAARARAGRPVYPLDEDFLAALAAGLPPCGGIALGFDRLLMLLADRQNLADALPFPAPA